LLQELAAASKVPLLSANLTDEGGKALFPGRVVVKAGKLVVCAVAVSKVAGVTGVVQTDPTQAAQNELAGFGQTACDVKLLLAHLPMAELEPLLAAVPGFDLAVDAHQGYQMGAKVIGTTPVVFPGERGRQVLRLVLKSSGGLTPFADEGTVTRLRDEVAGLDKQIAETLKRKAAATPDAAKAFDRTLDTFQKRREDLQKQVAEQKRGPEPRVFQAELVNLGTDVADDPVTLAAVDRHLASFPEAHPVPGNHPLAPLPPPPAPR